MFGRVGIIKHTGDTDEILKILRSKEDLFQSADGLISVTYIKISDSEFLGYLNGRLNMTWKMLLHWFNKLCQTLWIKFLNCLCLKKER